MDVMGTSEILARSALEMCDSDKNSAVLLLMDSYSKVEQYAKDKQLAGQKSTPNSNDNNNNNTSRNRSNNNNNNGRFNTFQQNHKANLLNLANNAKNWFKKSIENLVNDDDNDSIIDSNLRAGNNFRILEETSIIPLGSNIRTNFKFILTNFDVLNITFQSEKELFQARLRQLYEIYDKKLNAKVVFVPIDKVKQYHLGNVANTELFEKCKKSTELHFPTINEQLRVLTETYLDNLNEDENENIQEGEFFVTRHSNLFNIQLVVHIMLNLENDLLLEDINQKSALIIGFRNLISSSSKLKIHSLQIPIISPIVITNSSNNNNLSVSNNNNLSISPSSSLAQKLAASTNGNKFNKELSRSSSPSSTGTKRIEEFFKCLKNMFIEFSRTATPFIDPFGNSLDEQTLPTITFVLPNENTGKLSGSLLSFNASFNAVKNSFGIVFKANDAE
ncbi:hypothetical protein K502DRAFT_80739 [Neoconidiobolus thromboides FSU 785]|nr:hypothetical protein K502DRAFT_80739 [Neoconidiobolus thromboides FSU 785]